MRLSGKLARKRLRISSVTLLLPAPPVPVIPKSRELGLVEDALFQRRDHCGDIHNGLRRRGRCDGPAGRMRALDEVVDHRLKTHLHTIVGVVDALDAVVHQLPDFLGRDRAATAAEHAYMPGPELAKPVHHVTEELVVPALVGADGDAVGVLLDGRAHDVVDAAIVAEVHDFHATRLDQAPHYVNGRIVTIEQRCRRHEA